MSKLIEIRDYKPLLDVQQNELAIKLVKSFFQENLATGLKLHRTTGPLFVLKGTGINDDLSGTERAVTFPVRDMGDARAEVVHSLAKWKRLILADHHIEPGYGIYTDMNAIRADEELDNTHSLYVDQWDWERVITPAERTTAFLRKVVKSIYSAMLRTEFLVCEQYPQIRPQLTDNICFIHAEELRRRYPDKTAKEREDLIAREKGSVFIIGIGGPLGDGKPHDLRAPDYDDYSTPGDDGLPGLNGDLIVWDDVLQHSLEPGSPRETAAPVGQRRPSAALLPPQADERRTAAEHRRRHWAVAPVHALLAQGPHRRSAGQHMARRHASPLCRSRHQTHLTPRKHTPKATQKQFIIIKFYMETC